MAKEKKKVRKNKGAKLPRNPHKNVVESNSTSPQIVPNDPLNASNATSEVVIEKDPVLFVESTMVLDMTHAKAIEVSKAAQLKWPGETRVVDGASLSLPVVKVKDIESGMYQHLQAADAVDAPRFNHEDPPFIVQAPTAAEHVLDAPAPASESKAGSAANMKAAWAVIAAGIVTAMHVGKMSAALPLIQQQLQFSLVESGLLLSFIQLAGMCLGLAMGISAQSIGLRRCMIVGLGTLSVSSVASTFVDQFEFLLLFRAIEGIGLLMVALSAPNLIRQLVSSDRMSAMLGIWGSYMSFGMALALLMSPSIVGLEHWQFMWNSFAALSMLALLAIWKLVPAEMPSAEGADQDDKINWAWRLKQTVSRPQTWFLGITFTAYSAPWVAVMGFLPSIYVQGHLSMQHASALTAWVVGMSILGNVFAGHMLQKGVKSDKLIQVGFLGVAIGGWMAFGLADESSWLVSYTGALLFSLFSGFVPATLFAQSVRVAPNENCISTTVGLMQQFNAFGQFIGPSLAAHMASAYGGWQMTWVGILSFASLGILTSMAMHDRMKKAESQERLLYAEAQEQEMQAI